MLAFLFIAALGIAFTMFYRRDRRSSHALRQNYPVLYSTLQWLSKISPYVQRYILGNTHHSPFPLEHMRYIHQAAEGKPQKTSFGVPETAPEFKINHALFPYPHQPMHATPVVIGKECRYPYLASKRLFISGMGFGVLSDTALHALRDGARDASILMNTGEAGLPISLSEGQADLIFQIGVGGFLCKDIDGNYSAPLLSLLAQNNRIKMFEIKLSQGAHPGLDGGFVPAERMTPEKALARGIMPFRDFSAGNLHANTTSISELLALITLVKRATEKPVGIKLCVSTQRDLELLIRQFTHAKPHGLPDFITVDGAEGGTFISSPYVMKHIGMPLIQALPMVHQLLTRYQLRDHVKVFASGKLSSPERAAWAFSAGADMIGIARGFMMAMGCVQAMVCAEGSCPSGVTITGHGIRRPALLKSTKVLRYAQQLEQDLFTIARACGVDCYSKLTPEHIEPGTPREQLSIPVRFLNEAQV